MNEFDLIRHYFDRAPPHRAVLGIGDDAALLDCNGQTMVVATDMLVQGRHFFADADPAGIGYKSLVVNLSDLAAMGARPNAFTLAIALPVVDPQWLSEFSRGLFEAADQYDCELVGGDTTRGPLTISITAIGMVPAQAAIRRDQAQPGDDVWVSGALGAAAAAVAAFAGANQSDQQTPSQFLPSTLRRALDRPEPRLDLGVELRHIATAAIDVSDGLIADLGHITDRSRVAITVWADKIPINALVNELDGIDAETARHFALSGGDDYELAFTSAPENRQAIAALSDRLPLALTRIGEVRAGQGVDVIDANGHPVTGLSTGGYDHFGQA